MKKTTIILSAAVIVSSITALPTLAQTINKAKAVSTVTKAVTGTSTTTSPTKSKLSNEENVKGLKGALSEGITDAILKLNKKDGYMADAAVKILLPPEAQSIIKNIKLIPGGQALLNDFILRMNRAAEDAAIEAKPIFIAAITGITIADGWAILTGGDNSATTYLKKATFTNLHAAFKPKISTSLNKKIVGNFSAGESWTRLTTANNKAAGTVAGKMANMKKVNTNLGDYVTTKALDGLFLKIADKEKSIRKNPISSTSDIVKKVFSQLKL